MNSIKLQQYPQRVMKSRTPKRLASTDGRVIDVWYSKDFSTTYCSDVLCDGIVGKAKTLDKALVALSCKLEG